MHNRLPPRSGDSFSSSLALASFRSSAFALNGVAVMARDVSAQLEPKILWGQNWILNSVECTDPDSRKWKQDQSTGWQPVPWNYLIENLRFNFFGGVYKKMEPRKKLNNVSADWLPGSALILFWGPTKKSMHYVDIQYESWQTYHWYPFMFWTHLYWAHEWVNQRKTDSSFQLTIWQTVHRKRWI